MDKYPVTTLLKFTRALFFVDATVWLVFAVLSFLLAVSAGSAMRWVLTLLMGINAGLLAGFGVAIVSGRKPIVTLAIIYVAVNAVLSITDQFGLVDALILCLNLCVLGALFVSAQRMEATARKPPGEQ
jgi:hypothetical protein